MVGKDNKRLYITLTDAEVGMLESLAAINGNSKSEIIKRALAEYVPQKIDHYVRYYRRYGYDAFTKKPLSDEEMKKHGLDWDSVPELDELTREVLHIEKERVKK